jgi:hypothetical protein
MRLAVRSALDAATLYDATATKYAPDALAHVQRSATSRVVSARFRGNLMKTLAAGVVGALFGMASVLAFLYVRPERKLFTVVNSTYNIPVGMSFVNEKDCETFTQAKNTALRCMAVDNESALIFAVSAVSRIEPNCDCDCSH